MNWYKIAISDNSTTYTIQSGDTLSLVAKKFLGDVNKWNELLALNPHIKDPNKIKPGDIINIRQSPQSSSANYTPPVRKNTYTIVSGDTLSSISKKYLGNANKYEEIIKINPGLNPLSLQPGTVINLPDNAKLTGVNLVKNNNIGDPLEALKQEIGSSEGSYGSYNRGKAGDTPKPTIAIQKMTIRQIMDMQSRGQLFAVGKYQFIPTTLSLIIKNAEKWGIPVTIDSEFSPENQDMLFLGTLYKQPMLIGYLKGKHDDVNKALIGLAQEYASIPGPSGRGIYDGDKAGNMAHGGEERVRRIIETLKELKKLGIFK
jgi:LysM repeat protein